MRKPRQFLFVAAALLGGLAPAVQAAERADVLRAINWVENPTNHTRRGSKGELGPYQFMPKTWRLHTKKPFNLAVVREHADEVAVKHYEWIRAGLQNAGIDPSPYNIALAWNSGLGAVTGGRVPMVTYNYAERVQNLVEVQRRDRAIAAAAAPSRPAAPAKPVAFSLEAPAFVLNTQTQGPRFALETEPAFEPVVYTEKAVADARTADVGNATPTVTFGVITTPRFALIQ